MRLSDAVPLHCHMHTGGHPLVMSHHGGPLQWTVVIVSTVVAIVVLVAALAVLLIVLVVQPRLPYIGVRSAHLNQLVYDQQGVLNAELSLGVVATNDNARTDVSFSDLQLSLRFRDMVIALMRADPFDVPKKGTWPLGYMVRTVGIPLDDAGREVMETSLNNGVVPFAVAGQARAHWKVAAFVSVKFWTHLTCDLRFFWPNGTALAFTCTSKSH